jgi:hypothetical protein
VSGPLKSGESLFAAEEEFAVAYDDVVEQEAIFVGARVDAGAGRAAREADAGRGLENVGGKRAALRIELYFEISGVGNPGDLFAGIDRRDFRQQAYHHDFFRQFV